MRTHFSVDRSELITVNHSLSQSAPYVGIELLGQLKNFKLLILEYLDTICIIGRVPEMSNTDDVGRAFDEYLLFYFGGSLGDMCHISKRPSAQTLSGSTKQCYLPLERNILAQNYKNI